MYEVYVLSTFSNTISHLDVCIFFVVLVCKIFCNGKFFTSIYLRNYAQSFQKSATEIHKEIQLYLRWLLHHVVRQSLYSILHLLHGFLQLLDGLLLLLEGLPQLLQISEWERTP